MSSDESMLQQLEHLIFDEHKVVSYKWLSNHFQIHVQKSKHLLADFVSKHGAKLLTHHCITGYRPTTIRHGNAYDTEYRSPSKRAEQRDADIAMPDCSETVSAFTILLAADSALESSKSSFDRIVSVDVHSVSRSESKSIPDFHDVLYHGDCRQQQSVMASFLSQQIRSEHAQNGSAHPLRFSAVSSSDPDGGHRVHTVGPPHLHRAIAPTPPKERTSKSSKMSGSNSNHNAKRPTLDEAVDQIKREQKGQTPLKNKFEGLALGKKEALSAKDPAPHKKAAKKGGIASLFAKQEMKRKDTATTDPMEIEQAADPEKSKKAKELEEREKIEEIELEKEGEKRKGGQS